MIVALLVLTLAGCDLMPAEHTLVVGRVVTENAGETVETVCALVLNGEGRIALARIDEISYPEAKSGASDPLSKKALGDDYNMATYNPAAIGEWYEQVAYLERALVGKTRDEALAIETKGAEIVAGCTISVDPYIAAVEAAFDAEDGKKFDMSGDPHLALVLSGKVDGGEYISVVTASALFRMQTVAAVSYINRVSVIPAPSDEQ